MAQSQYAPPLPRRGFRFSTREITITGVLGAVAGVLGYSGLGFIPIPVVSGTTLHIPAIIAGVLAGPVVGAFVGGIFGFFSFIRPTTSAVSAAFKNPIIAFGPRILIGVVAFLVFTAVHRRFARILSALALGAGIFTILGPGAQRFESAFAAGKLPATWHIAAWHAIAAVTAGQVWISIVAAAIVALLSYWALAGENAAPAAAAVAGTLTNTVGVLTLMVLYGFIPVGGAFLIGATNGLPEVVLAVLLTVPIYRAVVRSRAQV